MVDSLFNPHVVRDSCGFGLVAHLRGEPSHLLLERALESLRRMTHRGAIAADGVTGDGCGVLLKKPDAFLRAVAIESFGLELGASYAVGNIFLNPEPARAHRQRKIVEYELGVAELKPLGWRPIPIDKSQCGDLALSRLPRIEQLFVDAEGLSEQECNLRCFEVRRRVELALAEDADEYYYICSLSASTLCYKGLLLPAALPKFYLDLQDERMATGICSFHQRFSTNTLPRWSLAQPFRFLSHNGEINTILGNRNWCSARQSKLASQNFHDFESILPLVNRSGSDSSSLDNMLEVLRLGGMGLFRALRMLIPPAWQCLSECDDESADLRAFYEYNSMHLEPWDGPAGIVLNDGRYAVCLVDRNGLRPARYVVTRDDFITIASEVGTWRYSPESVVKKGRVGSGQILVVDTERGEILDTRSIDDQLKAVRPYREWLQKYVTRLPQDGSSVYLDPLPPDSAAAYFKQFQVTFEERSQCLRPLAKDATEGVGSMGDDTPIATMSRQLRPLYDAFRQQFAQVTNPPIDSLREKIVMSLETCLGREHNIFIQSPEHAERIILRSPILLSAEFALLSGRIAGEEQVVEAVGKQKAQVLDCSYPRDGDLHAALVALSDQVMNAVNEGACMLILSDRAIAPDRLPIHSLLATGIAHHSLIKSGQRCDTNLIVESGSARDAHQLACLFGFGATAVYPYMGYAVLDDMIKRSELEGLSPVEAHNNYRSGLDKGLLKVLSKMGISTISSYRGAQLFEALGIAKEVVNLCFRGLESRIGGMGFADLHRDAVELAKWAWNPRKPLSVGGVLKFVYGNEDHAFNPDVVMALQCMAKSGEKADYQRYAQLVNQRPVAALRDLLRPMPSGPELSLEEVEPIAKIFARFDSAGMSLGALSPEAHEALAIAMNHLGGRSNSGEGGEDPARFGGKRNSRIKQVASGRFGVTPHYLVNADVLQIKIAQGAKPGEGGQLPGIKVSELIARLRCSSPGITLISPPPHHDIYSIEDLAQLIFDLKQVNPKALVSVKLVAEPGVGTIAVGVAKAYADLITISGYDGGTAASPLSSIRYAGSPWELGLAETHQALRANGLRGQVRVQADGGLKTGLDVVKAAMLGAESFGFGTAPMVALGCKYLRICHLNNCATGVATQDERLRRDHFVGTAQRAINFFTGVATEVREILASLGFSQLEEAIGRCDLLEQLPGDTSRQRQLDLRPLLAYNLEFEGEPNSCQVERNPPWDKGELAERMVEEVLPVIESCSGGSFQYQVYNHNRTIGARISGEIAKRHGDHGMEEDPVDLLLHGTAGQSLGAWNAGGLNITLWGDANDYVGKGMAGGRLVLRPPLGSRFKSEVATIMGNTCLYGATSGELYAAGCAGERFAVRNSGAKAVVEGVGDHCCEYMTGGVVVVLGGTGVNFGAGMTGGVAFVLDEAGDFSARLNPDLVESVACAQRPGYAELLAELLERFVALTGSEWGREVFASNPRGENFQVVTAKGADCRALLAGLRFASLEPHAGMLASDAA